MNVTKTFLPEFEEYTSILKRAWDNSWITNNGELLLELEESLKNKVGADNLWFCTNGTVVLQMALKALSITKEVITTPFSYVATLNSIVWEGCKPVFVDIDPETLTIDAGKIEDAITPDTQAILATHVYGYPCDVHRIEQIAKKHNLKVIYDAAHAFGCEYKGKSLLTYGDIATCSFHATKIFHTGEGGCIVCHDPELSRILMLMRSFGHIADDYFCNGINGKNSEFHAAMGLAVLPYLTKIIEYRRQVSELYDEMLEGLIQRPLIPANFVYNYSYYPVIFSTEEELSQVKDALARNEIYARRYFYPSLNVVPQSVPFYIPCPISEDISKRILCLPLFYGIETDSVKFISKTIQRIVKSIQEPV